MEAAQVIKIRETFRKATFTMTSRKTGQKRTFLPTLHVILDNSGNMFLSDAEYIDEDGNLHQNISNIVWDDDNEIIYCFRGNTASSLPNSPSASMSHGSASQFPMVLWASSYGDIQGMRIILNEEAYENICEELGELMSKEQKDNIYRNIFEETDMNVVISRKREVNYNTGLLHKYDPTYNEDSSYVITNHSDQGGAV